MIWLPDESSESWCSTCPPREASVKMEKSLEEKVEELWSREQIKSLTYAYGQCIVRRDAEAMANLFVPEAVVDFTQLGAGVHPEREAIKKFYETTWPARVKPFFLTTT